MDRIIPSKEEFLRKAGSGEVMPLAAELDAPGLTPLAALEALRPAGHAVLLESARVDDRIGRYSFVTADPYLIFKSRGDAVELILPADPGGEIRQAGGNEAQTAFEAAGTSEQLSDRQGFRSSPLYRRGGRIFLL